MMAKTAIRLTSPPRIDFLVVTACIWNPLHFSRNLHGKLDEEVPHILIQVNDARRLSSHFHRLAAPHRASTYGL
jgi:hypothetical protein